MDESSSVNVPASDAELLNTIRSGGTGAPALLRGRHVAAARALAGQLVSGQAADDVAAGAFAQVLDAIRCGGGPTDAFRPYLLTAVRRAAGGSRGSDHAEIPADEQQISDPGQPFDPAAAGREAEPLVAAFLSLPERWRAVLWHTEIERATPSQVAPLLGLPAAGVTELADRAADGLRQAYLQLPAADARRELADLADIGAALRSTVAPVFLGDAAAAYLASLAGAPVLPGSPASPGSLTSPGSPHSPGKLRRSSRRQHALAAGALLTSFGVAAYVLTPGPGAVVVTADGQSTVVGHGAVSGHRAAAIALGPLVLPASAQAQARPPVKPPVASHRDSASRRPPEAAAPVVAPAPTAPSAQPTLARPTLARPPQAQRPGLPGAVVPSSPASTGLTRGAPAFPAGAEPAGVRPADSRRHRSGPPGTCAHGSRPPGRAPSGTCLHGMTLPGTCPRGRRRARTGKARQGTTEDNGADLGWSGVLR